MMRLWNWKKLEIAIGKRGLRRLEVMNLWYIQMKIVKNGYLVYPIKWINSHRNLQEIII